MEIYKKPKIALMTYAIDGRPAKGTAILARKYTEAFIKAKEDFDLTFFHFEKSNDPIYSHGIKEVIFPEIPYPFLNKRFFRQIWFFINNTQQFDVAMWFQPRLYPFFWKIKSKKIFVCVHGTGDLMKGLPFDLMRYVFNWVLKNNLGRISAAFVGSQFAADDIMLKYGFVENQVKILYYGADGFFPARNEEIQRVRRKYLLPDIFFLGVGRLNPNKNIPRVLKAFEIFKKDNEPKTKDVHFVNIGSQGSEKALVDSIIQASQFKNQIHLVSYVDVEDLPAVYSASQGVVFPLLNEGLGLPVIEAMHCAVPVLASNTCFPDLTNDDVLLVDALDERDIARGITELWSDGSVKEKLIKNSQKKIELFSWNKAGEELVALCKKGE